MSATLAPLVAVVRVTEACNLSCGFCAYDRTLPRARAALSPARVIAFGRSLAEQARRAGRRVLLSFLGGEPCLWPGLPEVEEALAGELELSLTTNGTTLGSAAVRERLLSRYRELTVSVDGLPALHDRLRGWPGGFALLERELARLAEERRTRGAGPLLRVNTVLMADNAASFPELCRRLAASGIDEITFNQLGGRDRPDFYALHRLAEQHVQELRRVLPELRASLAAAGVRLRGGHDYLERFAASARSVRLPVADCGPGRRFLFVSERGLVAPCSFTVAELGVDAGELELGQLPSRFEAARARRRPDACGDCPSTQVFAKFEE